MAGKSVALDVLEAPKVRARAFLAKNGKHRVGLVFQSEKRLGQTLYRDGKRITIRWQ